MNQPAVSPYIYINKPIPTRHEPPNVVAREVLSAAEMRELLTVNDPRIAPALAEGSTAERILALFTDPAVLLGPIEHVTGDRERWLQMISSFTEQGAPIEFVAMAFPYKVPNPIKTGSRLAPDAGEALMLRAFSALVEAIEGVYPAGARVTILEEGILGRCQGVDPAEIAAYRAGIARVAEVAGVTRERIAFHSLDDMVQRVPSFEARWYFEQERLRRLWESGDAEMREAYDHVHPGQRTAVPMREYEPETIARAFDPEQTASELRYLRDWFETISHRQFFAYRALLNIRDASGYLHDVRPGALKLTVSPKAGNLGVVPINPSTRVLPYHGVPVLEASGTWTIDYFGALGERGELIALHVDGDADAEPFAYRERR